MPAGIAEDTHLHDDVEARDRAILASMGYKQELKREWSLLQNFGISFSIISCITGITTLFNYGLITGGPSTMVYGWIIVSIFTMTVALGMAEIVSAFPNAGGPYFWAAMISSPKRAPLASWVTGYFNLLGQVAVTTGISYGCAGLISTSATLGTSYEPSAGKTLGIYAALLFVHGCINTFTVKILKYLNNTSVVLHSAGCFALLIALWAKAPTHQSADFVFRHFYDGTGGWAERASPAYVCIIGILLGQYTITGFDASAHLAEETHNAAAKAPWGVILAVGTSAIFGFFMLLTFLFCIQDWEGTLNTATGNPVTQIFIDCVGLTGARVLMTLVCCCVFLCGAFSMTANSRMMYAFSRDGGMPGSKFWHYTDKNGTPVRTIWLAAILAFCLAIPSVGSAVAFSAATSIATSGLYISYGICIAMRAIEHKNFEKGPWHLGRFSIPIAIIASLWVCFITIVFCLPELNPVDSQTLNYTPVACGIIALFTLGYWVLSARKWFTGPRRQLEEEEAAARTTGQMEHVVTDKDDDEKHAGFATTSAA